MPQPITPLLAAIVISICILVQSKSLQSSIALKAPSNKATPTVLFLPLDERFTTRDAFLNLAKVTPFQIITPNTSLLPLLRQPAPLDDLLAWVDDNIASCDAAIISSEMFLYGGLIASW